MGRLMQEHRGRADGRRLARILGEVLDGKNAAGGPRPDGLFDRDEAAPGRIAAEKHTPGTQT
jgi:hypothetical protein